VSEPEVYHPGEIAVQTRTGDRSLAARRQAMIANHVVDGARAFLQRQGVVAVGAADTAGRLWASLWCGAPGFLRAGEDGEQVEVDMAIDESSVDPARPILRAGTPLALLAIDLVTRQRFRINGTINCLDRSGLQLDVREAFGNCMKYIQKRQRTDHDADKRQTATDHGLVLDGDRRSFIARADTAFVASIHPDRGIDVSHRGGEPGFVRVEDARSLRIPDYPGNGMYQTLGNFEVDRRAGIALIDFERRRVLSLSGSAVASFGADDVGHTSGGTGRYWSFSVDRWVEFSLPSTMTWTLVERSPLNP